MAIVTVVLLCISKQASIGENIKLWEPWTKGLCWATSQHGNLEPGCHVFTSFSIFSVEVGTGMVLLILLFKELKLPLHIHNYCQTASRNLKAKLSRDRCNLVPIAIVSVICCVITVHCQFCVVRSMRLRNCSWVDLETFLKAVVIENRNIVPGKVSTTHYMITHTMYPFG